MSLISVELGFIIADIVFEDDDHQNNYEFNCGY